MEVVLYLICYNLQPGLAGINLGKFLIKRVVTQVKREMPHISVSILSIIRRFMGFCECTRINEIFIFDGRFQKRDAAHFFFLFL